ncbi:MAG: YbjN domain-containing protein, partial [Alphaproteobacteria bacterium]
RDCNSVSLSSGFDLADGLSVERANAFNYEWRWASVELDEENDPFLRMDINLIYGVSEDNFRDSFDTWRIVLEKFVTFIDW